MARTLASLVEVRRRVSHTPASLVGTERMRLGESKEGMGRMEDRSMGRGRGPRHGSATNPPNRIGRGASLDEGRVAAA